MSGTHLTLRLIHIAFGTAVLLLFWIPISTRKGGRNHRRSGRLYLWAGRVVVASAVVSCVWALLDPAERIGSGDLSRDREQAVTNVRFFFGLLGVLAVIALAEMERGVLVIRRAASRSARTWLMIVAAVAGISAIALGVWGLSSLITGIEWHGLVRIGVAALGIDVARRTLVIARATTPTRHHRQIAHLDAMLGSAGAFYTAFAAFGFSRLFDYETLGGGPAAFLPWIAPTIAAIALTTWWKRRITSLDSFAPLEITQQPMVDS